MTDFNKGYNAYCQGAYYSEYEPREWQRGWLTAQRDSYSWYAMQPDSTKEAALLEDKYHGE